MKPPPFLIGATVLFWGFQTDLAIPGVIMALVLEAPRWVKLRWDFSDQDFRRIWLFCALLLFASLFYAFTSNEGPSQFRNLFQSPTLAAQRQAGTAASHTALAFFRWLPMVFFLFIAAQAYSTREGVPVETVFLLLHWRWRRRRKTRERSKPGQTVNIAYGYFALCLFSACVHTSTAPYFFWGLCVLLGWGLWAQRSLRFNPLVWFACLGAVVGLGYLGQRGFTHLQSLLGNLNLSLSLGGHRTHDPGQTRADFGNIGLIKLSSAIAIRLEAKQGAAPPLLREASFRRYNGQTWFADVRDIDYGNVPEDQRNPGTYNLIPAKTNYSLKVNIGCYLEGGNGLLPLPTGAGRLENLSANLLAKSPLGTVIEDGPGVVLFDALYGPGYTLDADPDENQDLAVPPREAEALDQVIEELQLAEQTQPVILAALTKYFADRFTYSTYQYGDRPLRQRQTPLGRFLLHTRRGHCEYFATAGVLLLRRMHIPARYAVGYAVHEGSAGKFVVRYRDAHAWCLVWDQKRNTWRDIDFTPPSWVQLEAVEQGWIQATADFFSRVRFELSKFRWGQTHLRQYLLWGVVPILLALLVQIILQSRRRRRAAKGKDDLHPIAWPGLDSEFYRLEAELAKRGLIRSPNEPLKTWAGRLGDQVGSVEVEGTLPELLLLHYRYRFDPQGLNPAEREALRSEVSECLDRLRSTS